MRHRLAHDALPFLSPAPSFPPCVLEHVCYNSHDVRGGAFSGSAEACGDVTLLILVVRRTAREDKYRSAEGKKSRPAVRP
jgi:hypothetical protein